MTAERITTPHDKLTYQIVGCAMKVHRALGAGYREDTYQRALEVTFIEHELQFESQKLLEVYGGQDKETLIGFYIPDFIIANQIIVEIKALDGIDNSHIAQTIGYLATTACPIGLLINFGLRSLQWKRILPPKDVQAHQINRQWLYIPDWLALH